MPKKELRKKIIELVDYSVSGKSNDVKSVIWGTIDSLSAKELCEKTGANLEGYSFEIDNYSIKHIFKKHGNKKRERNRDQIAVTKRDFIHVSQTIENPHIIKYEGKNRKKLQVIRFIKQIENQYNILVEIRSKKKTIALITMFIKKPPL